MNESRIKILKEENIEAEFVLDEGGNPIVSEAEDGANEETDENSSEEDNGKEVDDNEEN